MGKRITLTDIENDHEITWTADPQFWYVYHRAVLLALKEIGILNETEYGYTEELMKSRLEGGRRL